ncbi:MAG: GCN5-related N-acetyltransferase [Sphingomonas sp.]|uniref:GCN5-related N-acetyltransferase n=1 Tax=Sphingomonas sp. TaxID=28214 RepID=UPI000DBC1CA9|nr:GCN5-related N-acetyltransferase [Sphingomonas sp.]PZU76008.1 MAG: GCN5-related N-acetyltransferase [Sphingomonas sp.]
MPLFDIPSSATVRKAQEARWLELTHVALPALAAPRDSLLRDDHCFQRVLLDAACGGCWYDHIPRRPAYAHAPDAVLDRAIAIGEALVAGAADLVPLDKQSRRWRAARGAAMATAVRLS